MVVVLVPAQPLIQMQVHQMLNADLFWKNIVITGESQFKLYWGDGSSKHGVEANASQTRY